MKRVCSRCGVSDEYETLAFCDNGSKRLVCQECNSIIEREWVNADPKNRKHSLDMFKPPRPPRS
jgi:transcription initiation factor TFIIIB Brf1 subunit/transcription initiation factor TFIIB